MSGRLRGWIALLGLIVASGCLSVQSDVSETPEFGQSFLTAERPDWRALGDCRQNLANFLVPADAVRAELPPGFTMGTGIATIAVLVTDCETVRGPGWDRTEHVRAYAVTVSVRTADAYMSDSIPYHEVVLRWYSEIPFLSNDTMQWFAEPESKAAIASDAVQATETTHLTTSRVTVGGSEAEFTFTGAGTDGAPLTDVRTRWIWVADQEVVGMSDLLVTNRTQYPGSVNGGLVGPATYSITGEPDVLLPGGLQADAGTSWQNVFNVTFTRQPVPNVKL